MSLGPLRLRGPSGTSFMHLQFFKGLQLLVCTVPHNIQHIFYQNFYSNVIFPLWILRIQQIRIRSGLWSWLSKPKPGQPTPFPHRHCLLTWDFVFCFFVQSIVVCCLDHIWMVTKPDFVKCGSSREVPLFFDKRFSNGEALLSGLSSLPHKKRKTNCIYDHGLLSSENSVSIYLQTSLDSHYSRTPGDGVGANLEDNSEFGAPFIKGSQ